MEFNFQKQSHYSRHQIYQTVTGTEDAPNLYVNYFLLQDLVEGDYEAIKFWSNFDNFETAPLPASKEEYISYMNKLLSFVEARNQRIFNFIN